MAGGLETHDGLCRQLVSDGGFKVIAIAYRLAPEHPYPAAVEDAWAAALWIEQNSAQMGVDGGRLAVGGDGEGGLRSGRGWRRCRQGRSQLRRGAWAAGWLNSTRTSPR